MRKYQHLSKKERVSLFLWLTKGITLREIARRLGRNVSTISREIKRNSQSPPDGYSPDEADMNAFSRKWDKPKLEHDKELQALILQGLRAHWSPEQISGSMCAEKLGIYACPQTIYAYLKRHTMRELLPQKGIRYRRRYKDPAEIYNDKISIHKRPKTIDNRRRYGDWEGDLVVSPMGDTENITVIIERKSRFMMSIKNENKSYKNVLSGIGKLLEGLPSKAKRSITMDRGKEFTVPIYFERSLGMKAYYCDGHSPWQKGGVENMNARIRRFLPKSTNFSAVSEEELEKIVELINNTPRKCLGFKTPNQVWSKVLAKCCT